jgi:hypothetical protein
MFAERDQENALVFSQGHPLSPGGFEFRVRQRTGPAQRQAASGSERGSGGGPAFTQMGHAGYGQLGGQGMPHQGRYLGAGGHTVAEMNHGRLGPGLNQQGGAGA